MSQNSYGIAIISRNIPGAPLSALLLSIHDAHYICIFQRQQLLSVSRSGIYPLSLVIKFIAYMTNFIEHKGGAERTVICPICKESFICGLSSTCWCATRKVPAEVKEYLAERYETCICSTCLDRLIEQAGTGESA